MSRANEAREAPSPDISRELLGMSAKFYKDLPIHREPMSDSAVGRLSKLWARKISFAFQFS
jgi:hypothetical protein